MSAPTRPTRAVRLSYDRLNHDGVRFAGLTFDELVEELVVHVRSSSASTRTPDAASQRVAIAVEEFVALKRFIEHDPDCPECAGLRDPELGRPHET